MNPPAGLRFRHPLYPVDAAFKLEPRPGPVPLDSEGDLLYPAQLCFAGGIDLHLPAPLFRVHGIHPGEGVGEQGGFLPPYPGPYLQDDVLAVVGILGQQEDFDLPLQPLYVLPGLGQFLLGQLPHLRVGQQLLRLRQIGPGPAQRPVGRHQRLQLPLLPVQAGDQLGVAVGLVGGQPGLQLLISQFNGF